MYVGVVGVVVFRCWQLSHKTMRPDWNSKWTNIYIYIVKTHIETHMPKQNEIRNKSRTGRKNEPRKNSAVDHSQTQWVVIFKRITRINANVYAFSISFSLSFAQSATLFLKWKLLNVFVEIQLNFIYTYMYNLCVYSGQLHFFSHVSVCTKCIHMKRVCVYMYVTFFIEWVLWCLFAICWFIALFFSFRLLISIMFFCN